MYVKSIDNIKAVASSELCNRCGSCVGLSRGKIIFNDKEGKYLPKIIGEISESEANRIWTACSGYDFDFKKYNANIYKDAKHFHTCIGSYNNLFIGHTTNDEIRRNSASGGILSAMLIFMLENGLIDGVITLSMSKEKPWLTSPIIAQTKEEIIEAAQSKYIISSVNEIFPDLENFSGTLAYVGIPPQIQSIRKLQHINDPIVKNIKYLFGPFYGNTLFFSSVKSFLKTHGVTDYTQITKLYFRYGEWPGSMRVELSNGRVLELKKFYANYLIPFHILTNSLYCTDFTNEFTDISCGDAWAPKYENKGKGYSIIISRTIQGQRILDTMKNQGLLKINPIDEKSAIKMHTHGYDFKKRGAFIRIKLRKLLGKNIPEYGYNIVGISISRYAMEIIISSIFIIFSTRLARYLVEKLPPVFVGKFFERFRIIWKNSTQLIKKQISL